MANSCKYLYLLTLHYQCIG